MLTGSGRTVLFKSIRSHREKPWYATPGWDAAVESNFRKKLQRARNQTKYLCAKAGALARSHPDAALALVDEFMSADDDGFKEFYRVFALYYRAEAYQALGDLQKTVDALAQTLAFEESHPQAQSPARWIYAYIVALNRMRDRYEDAVRFITGPAGVAIVPIEQFQKHAAAALILADLGRTDLARERAGQAIAAADATDSGMPSHRTLGLVGDRFAEVRERLKVIASGAS